MSNKEEVTIIMIHIYSSKRQLVEYVPCCTTCSCSRQSTFGRIKKTTSKKKICYMQLDHLITEYRNTSYLVFEEEGKAVQTKWSLN